MEEESTLVRAEDPKHVGRVSSEIKPDSYRLYFKGLVSEETVELLAGFGVAICDKDDNLLFQMKEQVHDSRVTVLEVEIMALKRGLTEAVGLGIDNISIYSDHYRIFELVSLLLDCQRFTCPFASILLLMFLICLECFRSWRNLLLRKRTLPY